MRPNSQFSADLVTFTEEILNQKLFLCSVHYSGKNHDTDHPINNQQFYIQYYFQIFRLTKRFTFI